MKKRIWLVSLLLIATSLCNSLSSQASGTKKKSQKSRYSLVPPPPPTAVSPTVLAAYPHLGMSSNIFIAAKPKNLAEEMKLTAVMDDVAFFSTTAEGSVHLQKGNSFKTVTVAQISPDEVVLEEKGKHYIKRLK